VVFKTIKKEDEGRLGGLTGRDHRKGDRSLQSKVVKSGIIQMVGRSYQEKGGLREMLKRRAAGRGQRMTKKK